MLPDEFYLRDGAGGVGDEVIEKAGVRGGEGWMSRRER